MARINVAVLRGGPSDEFDVSLKTGAEVLRALPSDRYAPRDVVITKTGEWLQNGKQRDPHEVLHGVDVVFNALHGSYGEDGTVQRLLERFGVPYTGSRSYSAMLAMNKAIAKDHLRDADIALPRHFLVSHDSFDSLDRVAHSITELFGPMYMVKPVMGGSSVGTMKADNVHMLLLALRRLLTTYEQVLVEEYIEGREATCGVIDDFRGQSQYVLPSIEIIPPSSVPFFNYDAKYSGLTREICPSTFSKQVKERIASVALTAHTLLGLSDYSRTDVIVGNDGHVYFLEVNTLPGLTADSLFPKALQAVGAPYGQFLDHLLTRALERDRRNVR